MSCNTDAFFKTYKRRADEMVPVATKDVQMKWYLLQFDVSPERHRAVSSTESTVASTGADAPKTMATSDGVSC